MALYPSNTKNDDYVLFGETNSTNDFLSTTSKQYTITNNNVNWTEYKDIIFVLTYLPRDHKHDSLTPTYQATYDFYGRYICPLEDYIQKYELLTIKGSAWQSPAQSLLFTNSNIEVIAKYSGSVNSLKLNVKLNREYANTDTYLQIYLRR